MSGSTVMTIVGAVALGVTALCCGAAALRNRGSNPSVARRWGWLALLAIAFLIYRAAGLEYQIADAIRATARSDGVYDHRQIAQALAVAVAIAALAGFSVWATRGRTSAPGMRTAMLAGAGYLTLAAVRLVSPHMIDALLYHPLGPLRLNWIAEAVLLLTIAGSAVLGSLAGSQTDRSRSTRRNA